MVGIDRVNGWGRLRAIMTRWPNLIPYTAIVDVTVPASASPELEGTAAGTTYIPPEGEFYVFATSVHGFQVDSPAATVLGLQSTVAAWPPFGPPDGWSATVNVTLDTGGLKFSNVPVRASHIFGSGDRPFYWPAPWIFPGGSTLRVAVAQRTSGIGSNRAFFAFTGFLRMYTDPPLPIDVTLDARLVEPLRRLAMRGDVGRVEPFAYAINFQTRPSAITQQRVAYLQQSGSVSVVDGKFLVTDLMGTIDNPSTTNALEPPDASIRINAQSGALAFDDRPQGFRNVLGTAREPGKLFEPMLIEQRDTLTALVNCNQAVVAVTTAPNFFLTFPGVRVFPTGQR